MKVVHFVPTLSIGGIESMSLRLLQHKSRSLKYSVVYFSGFDEELLSTVPPNDRYGLTVFQQTWFVARFYCLIKLIKNLSSEDIVILSTWRSQSILFLLKLFRKKNRIVAFHHRTYPAHFLDKVSRNLFYKFVEFNFCDSQAAHDQLPENIFRTVVRPFFQAQSTKRLRFYNRFCIVGRIHEHRNLPRALKFFYELLLLMPDISLDIIGPDAGAMPEIKKSIDDLGLSDHIKIIDQLSPFEVLSVYHNYDFLISTPLSEGMGMSIAEAMSAGVIPIVGPFGEPAEYCSNGCGFILPSYEDEDLQSMAAIVATHRSSNLLSIMTSRVSVLTDTIETCPVSLESQLLKIL